MPRIGQRYELRLPKPVLERGEEYSSHDQNSARLEEAFNQLPIRDEYIALAEEGTPVTLASSTVDVAPLPIVIYDQAGFLVVDSEKVSTDAIGWYQVTAGVKFASNGAAGIRAATVQLIGNDPYYAAYDQTPAFRLYSNGALMIGSCTALVPIKPGAFNVVGVQIIAEQTSAANQDVTLTHFSVHWVRPLEPPLG